MRAYDVWFSAACILRPAGPAFCFDTAVHDVCHLKFKYA